MSQNLRFFLIISSIFIAIDIYTWQGVKLLTQNWTDKSRTVLRISYWSYTVISFFFFLSWRMGWLVLPRQILSIILALTFMLLLAKLFWCVFLLFDDIIRLFRWFASLFGSESRESMLDTENPTTHKISRIRFLSYLGLGVGGAFFGTAIYGIGRGAHNYKVRRRDLAIKGLPEAFKGLRIVQISDIHSGSFWSTEAVKRGIKMVVDQQADMVFFTGDIVNDHTDELKPFKEIFATIKAPLGVYSILGNHDYGDYHTWPDNPKREMHKDDKSHMSPMQKANLEALIQSHKEMGWNLLLDEHRIIEKDGQKMAVIGVENWSSKARFPRYGSLAKAYKGTENVPVKLLLSHDPSHWKEEVRKDFKDIQATFSGHTHGMQFGIDSKYYRWSPVKMLYKEWIDMYQEEDQSLYVNRGFGYLGFPGRMGIFPEITVFTLHTA